tara:strand:- start:41 stop:484 length:444 start_codon:yes stop_codon:yes gene_type:complete
MTTIFTVTDNKTASILAFSSCDAMLAYVRDLHADFSPEGSTLMLAGVPATNKVVKALIDPAAPLMHATFTVAGDGADTVAALQSKLDGAIQACVGLGIDPESVAKVGELRAELAVAKESVATDEKGLIIEVRELVLHKRRKKKASKS